MILTLWPRNLIADSQELTSVKMFTQYNFIEGIYTSKYIHKYEP